MKKISTSTLSSIKYNRNNLLHIIVIILLVPSLNIVKIQLISKNIPIKFNTKSML